MCVKLKLDSKFTTSQSPHEMVYFKADNKIKLDKLLFIPSWLMALPSQYGVSNIFMLFIEGECTLLRRLAETR